MKKQVINRTNKPVKLAKHTIEAKGSMVLSTALFSKEELARLKKDSELGFYYIEDEKDLLGVSTINISELNEEELRELAQKNNINIPGNVKKIEKIREIILKSLKG